SRCCRPTSHTPTPSTRRWCAPYWKGGPSGPAEPWKSTATTRPRSCVASWADRTTRRPMPPNNRYLTLPDLRNRIEMGEIATVVLAFTDMQGRLQGKRLHAHYFLDVALEAGTEGCNYLLAVDIDMNTVAGYAMSSWEKGYGDMEFVPDWSTLRLLP